MNLFVANIFFTWSLFLTCSHALSPPTRREVMNRFMGSVAFGTSVTSFAPVVANSADSANMQMVTVMEFEEILKDSYKSVAIVEFGGVKGENAVVKLIDGTEFGISDIVESSTDPRSPLKLVATCKGYDIPTKFTYLDGFLASSPKRKKVYMNDRLAEAAKKEELKRIRIQEDEQARLKALYEMENDI